MDTQKLASEKSILVCVVLSVSCTGATNDHPKVWYTVPEEGYVQCGYCDIMFMRKKLTETERMDKHFNGTTYTKDGIDNDF